MIKLLFIVLISFGYAISPDKIYDNSWALLIGIDKYDNVRNLNYAVADAESMQDILTNKFDFPLGNITLLKNKNATRQNILQSFSNITKQAKVNDRVLIYFAGHGQTEDLPDGGEMGYLLPVDGNIADLYITAVGMEEFEKMAHRSNAKHILYLVDACYGGLAAIGSRSLDEKTPNYLDKITRDKARQIITAGGKGEKAIEKPEWGHSAFTLNLIRGLKDGRADMNSNGFITANELGVFLSEKVTLDSKSQQTPQYGRYTTHEGEFVFITSDDKLDDLGSIQSILTTRGLLIEIPQAFKAGTTIMAPYTMNTLDRIINNLNAHSYKSIIIESHTDNALPSRHTAMVYSDNWKLSLIRADEIFNYLLSKGIKPEKIIALGFADRWPAGITWEKIEEERCDVSKINSLNQTVNQRAKNRRINIIISHTESEQEESFQSAIFNENLFESDYANKVENPILNQKNISYKLIIIRFDENYMPTLSFPPIVGQSTGHLLASIPIFIMQAPTDMNQLEQWQNNINILEENLFEFQATASMGDSLTTLWGSSAEYYFKFYAQ